VYSDDDLNSAVAAGALSPEAAANFRSFMSAMRALPHASEEDFRLLNSFNDIFVSIGIVILMVALAVIGAAFTNAPGLGGALVALAAWPLAEFFTRKRRMALPSILLLLAFVGGVFATLALITAHMVDGNDEMAMVLGIAASALAAAGAAWLHWRRFMVPITVAAGTAAVAATALALIVAAVGPKNLDQTIIMALVLAAGLAVFAFAMRWDMSDLARTTRRSDVAFWLHLTAAPMIAHPVFALLGVTEGEAPGVGAAVGVLAVYVGFGLVALATDRRALLVSALTYVLFALTFLFQEFGAVQLNFALTALVIGSALLSLSAFWQTIRRGVVTLLPQGLQAVLPATEEPAYMPPAGASPA
jgi:hypothetical protein